MIQGVGIEIVALRDPPGFRDEEICQQIWMPGELEYCKAHRSPEPHLAARYAAKLAILKVLGIEQVREQNGIPLTAIEIRRSLSGSPHAILLGVAAERARLLQIARWHVSLTHEGLYAAAFVLAEGSEGGSAQTAGSEVEHEERKK